MEKETVIKALECCLDDKMMCKECPIQDECKSLPFEAILAKYALALIKQQDEQIFQLENRLKECENGYAGTLHIESCKLHDAEERIKELTIELDAMRGAANSYKMHYEKAKADTVREMQERIKKSLAESYGTLPHTNCFYAVIDRIAKEILNNTEEEKK